MEQGAGSEEGGREATGEEAMNEETLFQEALSRPPEERAAFLEEACAGRPELRAAVEALLAAHEKSDNILDKPPAQTVDSGTGQAGADATRDHTPEPSNASSAGTATADYCPMSQAGMVIAGRYTLQERIGQGGMGEVWVAKQTEPVKRRVALKLIKTGMDSKAVLARFEQERQALALMDHPNIGKVLDGGMTPTGQPFFVMELVNGLPLTKFCDEARLTPRERLELFVPICQAVQHSHQKGIVHRDLKPANILVTLIDGKPVPKIIDFGVAKATAGKLTDESLSTQFGAVVGTMEYMSPEQAGFSGEDIDTRADIYSLGVILYELLTGLRPIDAKRLKKAALTEMIRIVREEEPSRPSARLSTDNSLPSLAALRQTEPRRLMAMLRGELDWVVMKCLEKSRERRYETANGLARDIQRFLDGDPVEACPPSVPYRLRKFASKHRAAMITVGAFALLLVAATAVSTGLAIWANRERVRAVNAENAAGEQKRRAEDSEQLAIDAVKRFRDAVANVPELKNNPQFDGLRKQLLKEPLNFFRGLRERLQSDKDPRPESLARLAQASFDLGGLTDEIGDKQDALISYREALAIRRKLADANPDVRGFQLDLARSYNSVGRLLGATGKPAEALKAFESAVAIKQTHADANPTVGEFQRSLAVSHSHIAALLFQTGKPAEALKALESVLAIRQKLADANPAVTDFQRDLAHSHQSMGILLADIGKPAEALKAFESAVAIERRLAGANPAVTDFQRDVAHSHHSIGRLLSDMGKLAEALKAYESAVAIERKLVDANPSVTELLGDLARSYHDIGWLLFQTGRPTEAMTSNQLALAIFEKLVDANPSVTLFQSCLAHSHNNIGLLLMDTGKWADALRAFKSALAIRQTLVREHPESPEFASELGGTLHNLATIDLDAKRFEEARGRLRQAVEWQRKALAINPAHPSYRRFLGNHLVSLTMAARGLGDSEGVAEVERELVRFRESDPAREPLDARLSAIINGDQ
jgi:serine/threonine protein kinase